LSTILHPAKKSGILHSLRPLKNSKRSRSRLKGERQKRPQEAVEAIFLKKSLFFE
jgi:hypothetical protein